MKALRIVLRQNSANYKKEETVINKMTYPLPPFSTVIGALHNACGFSEYHPMDISIQGKFGGKIRKPYTDHCILNSMDDDRGSLVKFPNSQLYSTAFIEIAKAQERGCSMLKRNKIDVFDEELLLEYQKLKKIKANKDATSIEKKSATNELKNYRILTKSLEFYEILCDINLVIHVSSDDETLNTLLENVYNITSIGRSEDFVDVVDAKIVELSSKADDEIWCTNSMYIDYNTYVNGVKNDSIFTKAHNGIQADGTKYYMSKVYTKNEKKPGFREFKFEDKKKVIYTEGFTIDRESENILFDIAENQTYVVNFN